MSQLATREFWVSDGVDDAVRKAKLTLKKLGDLTAVVPGQHMVGSVRFGVQHVTLKIAWRSEEVETKLDKMVSEGVAIKPTKALGTMLVMEGSVEGGNDLALRSAFERFEEAYLHFDRTDFQPDRWGVLPITMIGIVVMIILLGVLLGFKTNVFKATPVPSPSASADAAGNNQ